MPDAAEIAAGAVDQAEDPSSSTQGESYSTENIAADPSIQAAFQRVFGTRDDADQSEEAPSQTERTPKTAGPTRRERMRQQEQEDELQEPDDGAEEDEDEQSAAADTGEDAADEKDDQEGEPDEAPTLNPLLRTAAKRAGWSDNDVDELLAANPEVAEKAFKKLLQHANDLSAEYSRIGRSRLEGQEATGQFAQQHQQQIAPTRAGKNGSDGLLNQLYGQQRLADLSERFGEDFVPAVIEPLLGPVQEMMKQVERQQSAAIGQEIGSFFQALPGEFESLYGKGNQVDGGQLGNREKLAYLADQIRIGAAVQGVELSVSDSLERANLQFASEHIAELERKRITQEVVRRSKQRTHRPTQRSKKARLGEINRGGGERSIQAAMSAFSERAREIGFLTGD